MLVRIDYEIFTLLNGLAGKSHAWDFLFIFLAEWVMFLLLAGLAVFVMLEVASRERQRTVLQTLAAAFVGRALMVSLIRLFFFRPRPFVIGMVTQLVPHNPFEGAFPSGHATVMFALSASLLLRGNIWWGVTYLLLALISSIARVIVGVHFPLDIIAGMLVGFLAAWVTKILFDIYFKTRQPTRGTR